MSTIKTIIAFLAGILVCLTVLYSISYVQLETPLQVGGFTQFSTLQEGSSPGDWISNDNIEVYSNRIVINVDDASISNYANTGSMRPTLDAGHNGIRIRPASADQIQEGDIITFSREDNLIVHRVIQKGQDETGFWFITRGDNNLQSDEKVYFKDIKYVTIGILY